MKRRKIFIATYENGCGEGQVEIFHSRHEAEKWLHKQYVEDFDDDPDDLERGFEEHKQYGAHTCKVWQRSL